MLQEVLPKLAVEGEDHIGGGGMKPYRFRGVLNQKSGLGDLVTWSSIIARHMISRLERDLLEFRVHMREISTIVDRDGGFGMKMFVKRDHIPVRFKYDPPLYNLMERE